MLIDSKLGEEYWEDALVTATSSKNAVKLTGWKTP
jgi:hypothetical protein